MDTDGSQRSLVEGMKHRKGRYGGFCFGGQKPDGVTALNPLPRGTRFPNGAAAALLLTFDVEGTYGNGTGDTRREIANYERICERLGRNGVPATFNVVGKMAEEHGPQFLNWMWDAGCEVAPHGYVHDLNKRYGGDDVYAGHYGPNENLALVRDGVNAINAIRPGAAKGFRLPYGHFNEYSYDAFADLGLKWASNVSIDDFLVPGNGYGAAPFQMQLGGKRYPIVEVPLDSQTYDWSIWMADDVTNPSFVDSVRRYCALRNVSFERTPRGAVRIWRQRMLDAIESEAMFTLLCHPINLAVMSERWGDPVDEFLLPVIDLLGEFHREGRAWVGTCAQMAEFYCSRHSVA
ncbi:MAG: polysaccharide deacetylase family protein [Candidatus Hydrogenedentes bacterium]|nr:polysaccharide deacetylase family protein [Candidatus Hydrogenedentota bacterium]